MSAPIRSYRDLVVWQRSIALVIATYQTTRTFPAEERFGLTAQMRRAAVSVPANIAEGHGRATRGEYLNQLSVARGSLNELATLAEIAAQLGIADEMSLHQTNSQITELQRMIAALINALRKRARSRVTQPPNP